MPRFDLKQLPQENAESSICERMEGRAIVAVAEYIKTRRQFGVPIGSV